MLHKAVIIILNCIIVSFFMFPVGFSFLPEQVNSKMIIAGFGIIAFGIECLRRKSLYLSWAVLFSALLAVVFSIWCYYCAAANGTDDTTYAQYWVSFGTWLCGAYGACWLIKATEGRLELGSVIFYLALVCLAQCVLALLIDNIPSFQRLVDSIFIQGQEFYHKVHRLYGIGASLDVAGVRFSAVLILIAHQLSAYGKALDNKKLTIFYFACYAAIFIIGSTIARTTWVGAAMGLIYLGFSYMKVNRGSVTSRQASFWLILAGVILITVLVSAWLYNSSPVFRGNLRFAFEGFFNWVEHGTFRTDSTDKLNRNMWIWPTDSRTWAIGTGIFGDFAFGTDIGFCRFTLYCGMIGLVIFSFFFVYNGIAVARMFPEARYAAILLIALTFVIWLKVATDIFFIYAMMFCVSSLMDDSCTSYTT